jgi:hypothetical protein
MSHRQDADRLMRALAAQVENPALTLDGNGCCLAELGGVVFAFSYDEERNCLFIQSHGGSLAAAEDPETVLQSVLQANHLWQGTAGAALGLDEASDELGLAYRLDFPLVAAGEEFPEDLLGDLLPRLAGVTRWCRDLVDPAEAERA